MKIRFWGVRGSIAVPGRSTIGYGGNTACVEVADGGRSLIFDAGTGIRDLGWKIVREKIPQKISRSISIFLSHCHFDHLCGLPFFEPLHIKSNTVNLYGPRGRRRHFSNIIRSFLSEEFFPISFSRVSAKLCLKGLGEERVKVDGFQINSFPLNHPGETLAYVVQKGHKKLAYVTDCEPLRAHRHLQDISHSQYEKRLLKNIQGVNLLIHDAHFMDRDYPQHQGWGHSSWGYVIKLAQKAGVRRVVFFHHSPTYSDKALSQAFRRLKSGLKKKKISLQVSLAREGDVVSV